MPGIDGLALQEMLAQTQPHLSLVFITGQGDVPMGIRAMKSAVDFLRSPSIAKRCLKPFTAPPNVVATKRYREPRLTTFRRRYGLLTPRERQVFKLVTSGLLNKEASVELGTSEQTIKVHRARVMFEMDAGSLAELVLMAAQLHVSAASKAE